MKTILRNFLTTLRRFKLASTLNILGLSVAFAVFMVILIQVRYERSFDKCYPGAETIFRVEQIEDAGGGWAIFSRPMSDAIIASSPQIVTGSSYMDVMRLLGGTHVTVDRGGERVGFKEEIIPVDAAIVDIFSFDMVDGERRALEDPGKVLISQSVARRLFGDTPAVGQAIHQEEPTFTNNIKDSVNGIPTLTVGGVYRDFPANSSLSNCIYFNQGDFNLDNWGNANSLIYLRLTSADAAEAVADNFNRTFDWTKRWEGKKPIRLIPVTDLYYNTGVGFDTTPKGNRTTTSILLAIAVLIIAIAAINFLNFSTALTPLRIRSINTQKVLGSPVSTLRTAMVVEAVGICLLAFIISIFIVSMLGVSSFKDYITAALNIESNIYIVLLTAVTAVVVGVLSGLYPAVYSTSFPPAMVLKGSFAMSGSGRRLRSVLIGFQYVVSIGLIIAAIFINIQNRYMTKVDVGYNKDNIVMVQLSENLANNQSKILVDKLKQHTGITDVAFSVIPFGVTDVTPSWGNTYKDKPIHFDAHQVSHNFLDVMGIRINDGRTFSEGEETAPQRHIIFNDRARREYGMELGGKINDMEIIGFTDNFNYNSARKEIGNMAMILSGSQIEDDQVKYTTAYVKVASPDVVPAIEHIKRTVYEIDPTYPANVSLFENNLNDMYHDEQNLGFLVTIFSLLAVLISIVGVFGLVVFETQYRTKEIGIRKIHGATVGEILKMFNRGFIRIVLICFVVAAPMAYFGISQWLESFVYRTPVFWWVFAVSLVIVMFITVGTVTFQSHRAATANPVNSIRG